jgi:hypothetical protein
MTKALLIFLFFAWPGWAMAQDQAADVVAEAGCGPANISFDVKTDKKQHLTGQVEPEKALVYVFADEKRDQMKYFGSLNVKVGVDGMWIGAFHYQSYFFFPVSAGEHRMCAGWQSSLSMFSKVRAAISFTVEPGKKYYFRIVSERRQDHPSGVAIEPLDSAEGTLLIGTSALSTSKAKK